MNKTHREALELAGSDETVTTINGLALRLNKSYSYIQRLCQKDVTLYRLIIKNRAKADTERMISFMRKAEAKREQMGGASFRDVCRLMGHDDTTYYKYRKLVNG